MQATEAEDEAHFTAPEALKRRLWWRFLGALALFGFLVGMMIGQLTTPERIQLLKVVPLADGLQLDFDHQPPLQETQYEGSFSLLIRALGAAQQGQLRVGEQLINWRVRVLSNAPLEPQLVLGFVAARPLVAQWSGQETESGWQLQVRLKLVEL